MKSHLAFTSHTPWARAGFRREWSAGLLRGYYCRARREQAGGLLGRSSPGSKELTLHSSTNVCSNRLVVCRLKTASRGSFDSHTVVEAMKWSALRMMNYPTTGSCVLI